MGLNRELEMLWESISAIEGRSPVRGATRKLHILKNRFLINNPPMTALLGCFSASDLFG